MAIHCYTSTSLSYFSSRNGKAENLLRMDGFQDEMRNEKMSLCTVIKNLNFIYIYHNEKSNNSSIQLFGTEDIRDFGYGIHGFTPNSDFLFCIPPKKKFLQGRTLRREQV